MSDLGSLICGECHAEVAATARLACCPACGGGLVGLAGGDLAGPDAPLRVADYRGILLPRRHAVGGVITPR